MKVAKMRLRCPFGQVDCLAVIHWPQSLFLISAGGKVALPTWWLSPSVLGRTGLCKLGSGFSSFSVLHSTW